MRDFNRRTRKYDANDIPMMFSVGRTGGKAKDADPTFFAPFSESGNGVVDAKLLFGSSPATFTRATVAWTRNAAGSRIQVPSGVARSYYLANGAYAGYLAEGARTNHFFNSDAPATQTSPSLSTATYTLWIEGTGSIAVAQNTATITGAGTATAGSPVTFVVTGAGTVDYTVVGSPTFAQSENGAFPSSWIVTAAGSVTRNADVLIYAFAGNADATKGAAYAELSTFWSTTSLAHNAIGFTTLSNGLLVFNTAATAIRGQDGTNTVVKSSLTDMSTGIRKRALSWGPSGMFVTGDGATVASGSFDGDISNTGIAIGCITSGVNNWFGAIKNVKIYSQQFGETQLQGLTG